MNRLLEGIYASAPEKLPFAPSSDIRAFLLRRAQGNLLVYSVSELDSNEPDIQGLGGISRHYLSHRHEAMFVPEENETPVFCHEKERASVVKRVPVRGTFAERQTLDGDFEIIPIPGHTSGATAFLWNSGEHRFLFTGDTIYLDEGEWAAAVLDSSDRAAYVQSLELIRELDFDVLVPWAATHGQPYHAMTDRSDAGRRIDAILERVRRDEHR